MNRLLHAACALLLHAALLPTTLAAAPSADLVYGIAAYNSGDVATAFRRLSAAATRGEAEAQVNLAYLYVRGHGVAHDRARAWALYQAAAKQDKRRGPERHRLRLPSRQPARRPRPHRSRTLVLPAPSSAATPAP